MLVFRIFPVVDLRSTQTYMLLGGDPSSIKEEAYIATILAENKKIVSEINRCRSSISAMKSRSVAKLS